MRIQYTVLILIAWMMLQTPQTRLAPRSEAVDSLFVLLKPGQVYTLRFDKPLPVSGKSESERPPYREWGAGYVEFIEVNPRFIRFRTLTLEEALKEVERTNAKIKKWGGEPVNPDFVRSEYEGGSPFNLVYYLWSPPQGNRPAVNKDLLLVSFSIETPHRLTVAHKKRVGTKGLEIKPPLNRTGARLFLIPEGKGSVLYIVPSNKRYSP